MATPQQIVHAYKAMGYKVERYNSETVVLTKEYDGKTVEQVVRRDGRHLTRSRR